MMLGLAGNVLHQGLCLGFSDRETTIATLLACIFHSLAFTEKRATVFGRENEMYQQTGKGLRHITKHKYYPLYASSSFLFALSALARGRVLPRPRKLSLRTASEPRIRWNCHEPRALALEGYAPS